MAPAGHGQDRNSRPYELALRDAERPRCPADVPLWLTEALGAPLLEDRSVRPRPWTDDERLELAQRRHAHPPEYPGRNVVVWRDPPTDPEARLFWGGVLEALDLTGSRLVGGSCAWLLRERREQLLAVAEGTSQRRAHLSKAAKARYFASLDDPFPYEQEHARATFVNTLTMCAPGLPPAAIAALTWWLIPGTADPFDPEHRRALWRLAERHFAARG